MRHFQRSSSDIYVTRTESTHFVVAPAGEREAISGTGRHGPDTNSRRRIAVSGGYLADFGVVFDWFTPGHVGRIAWPLYMDHSGQFSAIRRRLLSHESRKAVLSSDFDCNFEFLINQLLSGEYSYMLDIVFNSCLPCHFVFSRIPHRVSLLFDD